MSTYEMDDGDTAYLLELLAERNTPQSVDLGQRLADQRPIPVPVKIGAVVRAGDLGEVYLRWAYDNHTHSPWVAAGNHEQPCRTDEIGRITEVLSTGVDL